MGLKSLKPFDIVILITVIVLMCPLLIWHYRPHCQRSTERCSATGKQPFGHMTAKGPIKEGSDGLNAITPTYIVEEHHEVLKYWFNAAERGLMPKTDNVLLHIDGHADNGVPFDWKIIPHLRFPRNHEEITKMMQRNDVFIAAAAFTGLIRRFIWVWPPWDTDSDQHRLDYQRLDISAGTGHTTVNGVREDQICACIKMTASSVQKCYFHHFDEEQEEETGIPIDRSLCDIKTTGIMEVVSERRAILMMRSGSWITHKDNVILDIDEDFYGCEAAVTPLYNVGLAEAEVRYISSLIQLLVCAKGTTDERRIDKFYNYLIHIILDYKQFCETNSPGDCDLKAIKSDLTARIPELLQGLSSRIQGHLCKQKPEVIMEKLLLKLIPLSSAQLKAVAKVGVCLDGSPKTLNFREKYNMNTCDGYNRPNDTMVTFHTPDHEEINQRTTNLELILDSRHLEPNVITICRSVRDGYTPLKYAHKIESDILKTLISSFPSVSENFVFYDKDLLGGAAGWYGRHK